MPQRIAVPKNKRIGKRTLVKVKFTNGAQKWLMRCDCGNETWVSPYYVRRYLMCAKCASVQRGKEHRRALPNNKRIGKRVIVGARAGAWLMLCDCGNKTWVKPSLAYKYLQCRICGNAGKRTPLPKHKRIYNRPILATRMNGSQQEWLILCQCGGETWMTPGRARRHHRCHSCEMKSTRLDVPKDKRIGARVII